MTDIKTTKEEIKTKEEPKVNEAVKLKEGEVVVKAEDVTNLLKNNDDLTKRLDRLEKTANKSRLANYDASQEKKTETIVRLRAIGGKVITSWKTLTNNVFRDPVTKRMVEDQRVEVFYEDESFEKMDIITFNRQYVHIFTTVVETTEVKDKEEIIKNGQQRFKLETSEGKTYEIGSNFVN